MEDDEFSVELASDAEYDIEYLGQSTEEPDNPPLSGPVGVVLDIHYLQASFAIPADVSIAAFEDALVARCGGGPICARYACDAAAVTADSEVGVSRQRLHARLQERGYELHLAPPRPLTSTPGETDLDMAACILDVSQGRCSPRATTLALVAGDASFGGLLRRILLPRRRRDGCAHGMPSAPPSGEAAASAPDGHTASVDTASLPDTVGPAKDEVPTESQPAGLQACLLISESDALRQCRELGNAPAAGGTHAVAPLPAVDVRCADLLGLLPHLVPGIDLREVKAMRDRRRRRVKEATTRIALKEDALESKRVAKEAEREARRRAKQAEEEAKRGAKAKELEERKRRKEEEREERRRAAKEAAQASAATREKWRVAAAKKGFVVGGRVEACLLGGGTDGQWDGSWFGGVLIDVQACSPLLTEPNWPPTSHQRGLAASARPTWPPPHAPHAPARSPRPTRAPRRLISACRRRWLAGARR